MTTWQILIAEMAAIICIICSAILFYNDNGYGWVFVVLALCNMVSYTTKQVVVDDPTTGR